MGSGFNMPDGVYERDIPGYNDIEVDITFECNATDKCGEWPEENVTVDKEGGHDVEARCPQCGELVTSFYSGDDDESFDLFFCLADPREDDDYYPSY
jgi:hypothetical protein